MTIIFDLDGCLADCEHRKHFIQKNHYNNLKQVLFKDQDKILIKMNNTFEILNRIDRFEWQPDWKAFNEACDKDKPVYPVINIANNLFRNNCQYQIWSGRCESVRKKTEEWLNKYDIQYCELKMRSIGDLTPEHELKEKWFNQYYDSVYPKLDKDASEETEYFRKEKIEFVFDSDPKSIEMWRRKGIFVFDVNQGIREL